KKPDELEYYCRSGGLNLQIIGFFFFIGIVTCMDDLFRLTSQYDELSQGKEVIWFLGIAKVASMTFGINNYILNLSRYYKLSMLAFLWMAFMNVTLNYLFIPRYQIAGAALATSFSIIAFCVLNTYLVWKKMGIRPVSTKILLVPLLAIPSILLGQVLPNVGHPLFNIAVKGLLVSVLYIVSIVGFGISPDLNAFVLKYANLLIDRSRSFFNSRK
ncbi:MAG: polysaccharide biosynthesis C-terminal domain-containing protein, partial [Haliscomenobacter sp.]